MALKLATITAFLKEQLFHSVRWLFITVYPLRSYAITVSYYFMGIKLPVSAVCGARGPAATLHCYLLLSFLLLLYFKNVIRQSLKDN